MSEKDDLIKNLQKDKTETSELKQNNIKLNEENTNLKNTIKNLESKPIIETTSKKKETNIRDDAKQNDILKDNKELKNDLSANENIIVKVEHENRSKAIQNEQETSSPTRNSSDEQRIAYNFANTMKDEIKNLKNTIKEKDSQIDILDVKNRQIEEEMKNKNNQFDKEKIE
jgi:hypothetical protein